MTHYFSSKKYPADAHSTPQKSIKKSAKQTAIITAALHARGSSLNPTVMNLLMCDLVKGNLSCNGPPELCLHSPHQQGNVFVIKGGSSAHLRACQFTAADTVSGTARDLGSATDNTR
jgi:hypothetical protein